MSIDSSISLWELIKHTCSWITNLSRAREQRKRESVLALRKVISAARQTSVYMRQLRDTGKVSHKTEGRLTTLWTELGFALEDLGLGKLAKRCQITGKHWADPAKLDPEYLEKADIGLERIEQLAGEMLKDLKTR